jgi:hypothetical protein
MSRLHPVVLLCGKAGALIGLLLACLSPGGCGPMSPQGLAIKGAEWAGKQVIKREAGQRSHRDSGGSSQDR